MESRRSLYRFLPPFLKAQYFSREEKGSREKCTIFNISRKGVSSQFHTREKVKIDSSIHLDMFVPRESEPVNVKGIVKWIKPWESDFIGGIELTKILDKIEWTKLTFFLS